MARPKNLKKLLAGLSDAELDQLRELVKENPEVTKLKQQRAKLVAELETIDARLAELTGLKTPRRGRKPGRKASAKTEADPTKPCGRPGRKPEVEAAPLTAPKRRGRPPAVQPSGNPGIEASAPKKRGRKPMTEEQKAALRTRLAQARAAKATKVKRVIVDNDLITSPPQA